MSQEPLETRPATLMTPHNPSAPAEFLAVLLNGSGLPKTFDLLPCLISKPDGRVNSLEKLALMRYVKSSMKKPEIKKELERIVTINTANSLLPLIFGDCKVVNKFIMKQHTNEIRTVAMSLEASRFTVTMGGKMLVMHSPTDNRHVDKMIELLPALMRDTMKQVTFVVQEEMEGFRGHIRMINLASRRFIPHLYPKGLWSSQGYLFMVFS